MPEGEREEAGVERVLPRGRERVARLERSIGVPAKSRGTTARGFRNQGCLMPKWTLFVDGDDDNVAVGACTQVESSRDRKKKKTREAYSLSLSPGEAVVALRKTR